jgi:hypothetical protein
VLPYLSPHVSRIDPSYFPASIQHHQIGIPISRIHSPLVTSTLRNRRRRYGDRNFQTDLSYPEDEAAAPAFRPGCGQRGQGPTTFVLTNLRLQAPSEQRLCPHELQLHKWRHECGEFAEGPP